MHYSIDEITQKEMSRKEFLAIVGFGVASVFGIANALKLLTGKKRNVSGGYGSSAYGGAKR